MRAKTIIGRIGELEIPETIWPILQDGTEVNEMVPTTKKNIQKRFEELGLNPNDVVFDEKYV